jgi:hypothetical protein
MTDTSFCVQIGWDRSLNPLKLCGKNVWPVLTVTNFAFCIYVFHMILTVNIDYFLEQR